MLAVRTGCLRFPALLPRSTVPYSRECGPCAKEVELDMQCKVALVTGGATGIGQAVANELLTQNLYRVIIGDIDTCAGNSTAKQLNECHGKNKCCFMPLNASCPKQLEEVMKEIIRKFGSLHILVNNAALFNEKRWELSVDTNLKSVIHGSLLGIKVMDAQKKKGGNVVVNIGGVEGMNPCPFSPVFSATKAGVHTFSTALGNGTGRGDVRIVGLAPGLTDTPLFKDLGEKMMFPPSNVELTKILAKPKQKASSVGKAVVYLCQYADSGSLWVVEQGQLYKAKIPDKSSYLELITPV